MAVSQDVLIAVGRNPKAQTLKMVNVDGKYLAKEIDLALGPINIDRTIFNWTKYVNQVLHICVNRSMYN